MQKPLQYLKIQYPKRKKSLTTFLKKFDKKKVDAIDRYVADAGERTWQEVDCLQCANCCKVMTPTFTPEDITRIAKHLQISEQDMHHRWLTVDEDNGDVVNKIQPCQFLDLKTNMCSIYEVRPADCAGFPHFNKKPFDDYNHVHEQNIQYCPATLVFVTQLQSQIEKAYEW